jgi:hypothetical protein
VWCFKGCYEYKFVDSATLKWHVDPLALKKVSKLAQCVSNNKFIVYPPAVTGLLNIGGDSCFVNAALQVFIFSDISNVMLFALQYECSCYFLHLRFEMKCAPFLPLQTHYLCPAMV